MLGRYDAKWKSLYATKIFNLEMKLVAWKLHIYTNTFAVRLCK